ncbi:choice-of-anchor U domain-containing protein [endosymbiont of Lamellibrachia barhami]|uniref:choice-of-anchor U domain-containing protein n=1 Tax=endosymbiont of Lamellibrachia barhami TaxID=205975 RepID=UPI0015AA8526|nr:choice-of-anchor U domain-containing protein [endosymbiont of Lamellibrachia barhami]
MKNKTLGHDGAGSFDLFSPLLRLISSRTAKILPVWLLLIALLFPAYVSAAIISTVAGNGEGDASFTDVYNGALATAVAARQVQGLVTDADGNLYYNANTHVVKRDATTGLLTLIAGNGTFGFSGDGGPATSAALQGLGVSGLGFDLSGNLLIADAFNHRVRVIDSLGTILTLWGDPSVSGLVTDMEYDGGGTLFTVDNTNSQIWVTPPGGPTFIFAGLAPASPGFSGDGGQATQAQLNSPWGLALDAAGNVYVSDTNNHVIRRIDRITSVITTFAGTPGVAGYGGDGLPATGAQLSRPRGIDFDSAGNLFIADNGNGRVRRVDAVTGIITTVAGSGAKDQYGRFISSGDGGEATSAGLRAATNVALDADDNLFISDYHRVRRVAFSDTAPPTGTISINSGVDYTNSVNLILDLTCDDGGGSGCAQMRLRTLPWNYSAFQPVVDTLDYRVGLEGVNTVAVQFVDALGNLSAEFSASITVDVTGPGTALITSPVDRDIIGTSTPTFSGTAEAYSTVTLSAYSGSWIPIAMVTTDAVDNWTTVVPPQPDGLRTYRAIPTDRAGNVGWDGNRVSVTFDTTAPAPPVITQPINGSSTADRTPTFSGSAEQNSTVTLYDGVTVMGAVTTVPFRTSWSFTPTTLLGGGLHDISATATDGLGNVSAASAVISVTIIVPNSVPPVVTPPADETVAAVDGSGTPSANLSTFLGGATAVDDLDGILVTSHDAPATFPLGPTIVTFSSTDSSGNIGTATAVVSVADQNGPVVTPPADAIIDAVDASGAPAANAAAFLGGASALDDVDGAVAVTHNAPDPLPFGTTTVTFSAVDAAGHTGTATATITVADQAEPVVMAPDNVTLAAVDASGAPVANAAVFLSGASAADAIDGVLAVTHNAPNPLPLGATIVTFSATDAAGNIGTASATVTVTDQAAPAVTPPAGVTLAAVNAGGIPAVNAAVFLNGASATDNVNGVLTVTHNAPDPLPLGTTTVTFTAIDAGGNTGTATAAITVIDQGVPVVTPPGNVTLAAIDTSGTPLANAAAFIAGASASDNVSGALSVTNNAPDPLPLGATTVTFSTVDAAGLTGSATAVITITDQGDPVVTPPADVMLSAVDANGTPVVNAVAFLNGAVVADNVDGAPIVTHDAPNPLPMGDTTVTFTATDAAGNTGAATATVTVSDNTEPVISADVGLALFGNAALGGLNATAAEIQDLINGATAQDNVDGAVSVADDAPGLFLFGSTTFSFTAVDAAGNETNRTATVTVNNPSAMGDDAPAASGTGLTIGQSNNVGLDPNATTTDTDGDGVDDNQEVGDPANPSDQDGDGVLDLFESGNAASDASHVNGLAAETGTVDLQSTGQNLSHVTSSATIAGAPSGVAFPFGVISYETTVSAPGASQTVRLTFSEALPDGLVLYKVDLGGNYTEIPTAQWNQVDANSIDLTLTDGGPFDLDGLADGKIVDPLALGSDPEAPESSSGGGGSTSPWLFLLFLLVMSRRARGFGSHSRG